MRYLLKTFLICFIAIIALGYAGIVFAAGTIDSTQKYSQFLDSDLDSDGTNDFINWSPTLGGATVNDSTITGYIWGETVGWINLNPTYGGVTNTCSGILGGYAWGENTGWINFAPTYATGSNQPKINTGTGAFSGTVWSENYGWITLNSSNGSHPGLVTSWHGCATSSTGGGGGSSGSSTTTFPTGTPSSPTTPPTSSVPTTPPSVPVSPVSPSVSSPVFPIGSIPYIGSNVSQVVSTMTTTMRNLAGDMKWLGPALAVLGLLSTIPGLVTRLGSAILTFFFGRKKYRGVVFDSKTKETLDPAYVSVIDTYSGKEVATAITDMDGRYGFVLKKGSYKIIANKTHYQFPSTYLAGKMNDQVYDHLYFGEIFPVVDENQVITMNIPMDPLGTDWNQEEKRRMNLLKYFMSQSRAAYLFFEVLFVIGFVVSGIITYFNPVWWNIAMLSVYVLVAIFQSNGYGPLSIGKITKQKIPLPFALIRIFNTNLNREVAHKVTNDQGGYFALVPKADYYFTIEQKNADDTYTKLYTSPTMRADQGLINKSVDI